jgi:hypothetical protein
MRDTQAGIDRIWKSNRAVKFATRLGADTNHFALMNIKSSRVNQPLVDYSIEEAVVLDVIHVSVEIIVLPTGCYRLEVRVIVT